MAALGSALVDRARRVGRQPLPTRVEGSTRFSPVHGEWFKARLTFTAAPETDDAVGGRRRTVRRPALMYGRRDLEGNRLTIDSLSADDKIEVNSRELGRTVWQVTGDPEPIRRKRSLLGFEVPLVRVDEDEFERPVE